MFIILVVVDVEEHQVVSQSYAIRTSSQNCENDKISNILLRFVYIQESSAILLEHAHMFQFWYNIFFYNTEEVQLVYFARNSKIPYWQLLKNIWLCIIYYGQKGSKFG